jgi:hypothetical protein
MVLVLIKRQPEMTRLHYFRYVKNSKKQGLIPSPPGMMYMDLGHSRPGLTDVSRQQAETLIDGF